MVDLRSSRGTKAQDRQHLPDSIHTSSDQEAHVPHRQHPHPRHVAEFRQHPRLLRPSRHRREDQLRAVHPAVLCSPVVCRV